MTELAKSVVVALVFIRKEASILLVKQDYGQQYWSLPGESIEQAAVREVREETGLEVRLGRLVGVYSKPGKGELALTFAGEVTGGELRADNEIMEARYFPLAELPENIRKHLRQRVADYQAGLPGTVVRTQ